MSDLIGIISLIGVFELIEMAELVSVTELRGDKHKPIKSDSADGNG